MAPRDMFLSSLSSPRDKFFRDRSDPEGSRYQAKETKHKKENKQETETSFKND